MARGADAGGARRARRRAKASAEHRPAADARAGRRAPRRCSAWRRHCRAPGWSARLSISGPRSTAAGMDQAERPRVLEPRAAPARWRSAKVAIPPCRCGSRASGRTLRGERARWTRPTTATWTRRSCSASPRSPRGPMPRSALVIGFGSGVTTAVLAARRGWSGCASWRSSPPCSTMARCSARVNDDVLTRPNVQAIADDARSALQLVAATVRRDRVRAQQPVGGGRRDAVHAGVLPHRPSPPRRRRRLLPVGPALPAAAVGRGGDRAQRAARIPARRRVGRRRLRPHGPGIGASARARYGLGHDRCWGGADRWRWAGHEYLGPVARWTTSTARCWEKQVSPGSWPAPR